ncbi:LOW QUALITY PROTEIN: hypothetical protein TorRG33x02_112440 [Trema orientale]|uniref:Uncharacterized protein n=1 Tax=Trema orientale TaxID=63057 RepID=A0A2P5F5A5_TREOI|nr:LOW QUALITY PROTEIN: hypothetical protein TorRG33x02_112440 [Trema orientale]
MLPIHNTWYKLHKFLSSPNFSSRNTIQHIQNSQPLEHHFLLRNRHREFFVTILRQVPRVLRLRRLVLEENRNAPGENAVERGPPSRSITRRLKTEARL